MLRSKDSAGEGGRAKRKRGRRTPDAGTLQTHVLHIPAGGDVARTLNSFADGCRTFGVCVLSASGPIAAAVLWKANSPNPSTETFQGRFDLLSMTATFLPGGGGRDGTLAVSLAGLGGMVVGGVVAGPVVAAGTVIVVAATYKSPAYHCFDAPNYSTSPSLFSGEEAGEAEHVQISAVVEEAEGNNVGMEKCNERTTEHVEISSVNGDVLDELEQDLGLRTGVGEGGSGEEEVNEDLLMCIAKELQQCLDPEEDAGATSYRYAVKELEMQVEFADSCLIGGSDGAPNVFDGGFVEGLNGCGELFASDSFRVSPVYI